MYKRFIIIAVIALAAIIPVKGQTSAKEVESGFITALNGANTDAMAKLFFSSIDLTLPNDEGTYSKTQASMILKTFFKSNPPAGFVVKQSGNSNDGSRFTIGNYTSTNGSTFRILFLVKKIGDDYKVHLLEIEQEG